MPLQDKRILLGVSGGIAAYKSADLVRRLKEAGADVRVAMTAAAQDFVTALTFQALSGNPVHTELLNPEAEAGMGHIELARWADLILIAPASANVIARIAHGLADDLLTTVCLARRCPLAVAPAMNQAMWSNPATQANISRLDDLGILRLGPGSGSQACGDIGPGRMLEVAELVSLVSDLFTSPAPLLAGRRVLLTAGPTREAIDPVRYISNHSSGKMGYAMAAAAAAMGAQVTLISGPTQLPTPDGVTRIDTDSAQAMYELVMANLAGCDLFIGSAAVADYRPEQVANNKIKKSGHDTLQINLIKNPDIIAAVAALEEKPFTVGFAAETDQVASYAKDKLMRKKLDMVIANDVSRSDIGFNADNNEVCLFWPEGEQALPNLGKAELAERLMAIIAERLPPQ
ncbi:bifunctional phosphopantothenoylcysteine decarboxylase/phosphopantothenate--cysteine ligase CoaBC [Halioxenophilus sp. WMMB6]|uniref:bifunctional phosphopantothenoylcysteine decarboxylase/phosphopantothenate--cysteine ligase CoaBC n=1 Tax=Halioxenophilus sp. WMMB6 TaxID=3073815 RepID=UPI00295E3790|nr:bifunctional phosphopantothenoylcysteine decarboxylase/phosphopantothenate--cysteine ligase CoaBC [Halioxenophilus sp. WMMB6]